MRRKYSLCYFDGLGPCAFGKVQQCRRLTVYWLQMKVFLTGANGFIGQHVAAALRRAGCEVVAAVRRKDGVSLANVHQVAQIDFTDASPSSLSPFLEGVECIVNLAGVFAGGVGQSMSVNDKGAATLFQAAEKVGVRRIVHLSALGVEDARTPFARTKLAGERALQATNIDWIILRPSVVLDTAPSGSGGLIRGLAAQPLLPLEPAGPLDVVRLDDVVETIVRLVTTPTPGHRVLEMVGPERMALGEIVAAYRAWLGWPAARQVRSPAWLMSLGYFFGELAGLLGWRSPVRAAARTELARGATGDASLWAATTGMRPRRLIELLADRPATLQDRRFAQFYFLKPLIIVVTAAFWLGTGLTSLTIGYDIGVALLREGGMGALSGPSVIAGGLADIIIGLALLFRPTARMALWGAILISLFYVVAGTLVLPRLWEDPIGPMLKIWPLIALNIVALFMVRDR